MASAAHPGARGVARDGNGNALIFDPSSGTITRRLDEAKRASWIDDERLLIWDGTHSRVWNVVTGEDEAGEVEPFNAAVAVGLEGGVLTVSSKWVMTLWLDEWTRSVPLRGLAGAKLPKIYSLERDAGGRIWANGDGATYPVSVDGEVFAWDSARTEEAVESLDALVVTKMRDGATQIHGRGQRLLVADAAGSVHVYGVE